MNAMQDLQAMFSEQVPGHEGQHLDSNGGPLAQVCQPCNLTNWEKLCRPQDLLLLFVGHRLGF